MSETGAIQSKASQGGSVTVPRDDTPVLLNRPRARSGQGSVFGDERWYVTEAYFAAHVRSTSFEWNTWPQTLLAPSKLYGWYLINHEPDDADRGRGLRSVSPTTVRAALTALRYFVHYLESRGVERFCDVTADDLQMYVAWIGRSDRFSRDRQADLLHEVRRLWLYRHLLPVEDRLPPTPPWNGAAFRELIGPPDPPAGENKIPRIDERVMSALLGWSIRFVEDFSADIINGADEYRRLRNPSRDPKRPLEDLVADLKELIADFRVEGRALPGNQERPGAVDYAHLARLLATPRERLVNGQEVNSILAASGLAVAEAAQLVPRLHGLLDDEPWLEGGLNYDQIPSLSNALTAACLVVVAYLSGMRPGEVLNLRRGCLNYDEATSLWVLTAVTYKGVKTAEDDFDARGREREVPWVVCEVVAQAIGVMERLNGSEFIFPRSGLRQTNKRWRTREVTTGDLAMTDYSAALRVAELMKWVNDYCAARGRLDSIPSDRARDRISLSRFRRTLAWHICRRPRGVVAASIQYGHLFTSITIGYGGNAASGFPDDFAFERFLARLDEISAASARLSEGEHVSGPSADLYRARVSQAMTEFQGVVLRSGRQAAAMLNNPNLQIVEGQGMACVFDPSRALCATRTASGDSSESPDLGTCKPFDCTNVARTERDITVLRSRVETLADIVADPLVPPYRHSRERAELDRLRSVIVEHEQGRTGGDL